MTRPRPDTGSWRLAGWLFADLLLVLFVIALGSVPERRAAADCAASPPGSTSRPDAGAPCPPAGAPATAPVTTAPAGPEGLDTESVLVPVRLDPATVLARRDLGPDEVRRVLEAVDKAVTASGGGRHVGLALTFADNHDGSDAVGTAVTAADHVNEVLREHRPALFAPALMRSYWHNGTPGPVEIELFFLG